MMRAMMIVMRRQTLVNLVNVRYNEYYQTFIVVWRHVLYTIVCNLFQ